MTRARKPVEVHALQGTTPDYAPDSQHVGALPRPPKLLSKEAKKKFRAQARQLAERKTVTAGDADLLAIYAQTWMRWSDACEKIRVEGAVRIYKKQDANGQWQDVEKVNINLAIVKDCERTMLAILVRLGLTPKDRDGVRQTANSATKKKDEGQEGIYF